ncbi:MAG TPA: hypothetical protein VFE12_19085, partial [Acetobacteraceae bacterium]|nr:hypothetical protein [Acetobacteraceae bacterium]
MIEEHTEMLQATERHSNGLAPETSRPLSRRRSATLFALSLSACALAMTAAPWRFDATHGGLQLQAAHADHGDSGSGGGGGGGGG